MKLKEVAYMLGIKPKPRRFGFEIREFDMPGYGTVQYAQWLHPKESEKKLKPEAIAELKRFLKVGDFCIDIGAHTGDTSVPMALSVGKDGCVLALEPNEYVFPVLAKNASLNKDMTNIIPLMAAATPQDGEMEFEYSDPGFCNGGLHEDISKWKHGHAFKLKVQCIDLAKKLRAEYKDLLHRLRFIKIDTEGSDLSVVKSLGDIIDEFAPFIEAEMYKHTELAYRKELYEFLAGRNYKIYKIQDDTNLRELELSTGDLMRWRHCDFLAVPGA